MRNKLFHILLILIGVSILILNDYNILFPIFSTRNFREREPSHALVGNYAVTDCFITQDSPRKVEWMFATYQRNNTNTIIVNWYFKEQKDEILSTSFNASGISDNRFRGTVIPRQFREPNKEVCFNISSSDSTPLNTVSIWINTEDNRPIYRVYSNIIDGLNHSISEIKRIIINNY